MARQESEDRIVPEGRRKPVPSREVEPLGGGKAVPVKEAVRQLALPFATAESPRRGRGAEGGEPADRSAGEAHKEPKAEGKQGRAGPAVMEQVVEGLEAAFSKVFANKGAPGPDRQTIEMVRTHLPAILPLLRTALLEGSYRPGDIRRVWIRKLGGKGERGLGIPNVIDRGVQDAVRAVLEPVYEPTFHPSNHGFRPDRGCQTAITEARGYVDEGFVWVVDMDLEKFFDRVNHQRLMSRLAERVEDKRLLVLIGQMLKAKVVMPDGVKVSTSEGVPQGGPLSPLLSNVVLSELDDELARRGHRFVRYADDCNIYVRTERAGRRVMASVTAFLERRLRLRINVDKSAVARPETRHFLGYRLQPVPGGPTQVLLSARSKERLAAKVVELTPRNAGRSLESIIGGINRYLNGWLGHFGICTSWVVTDLQRVDAHLRRRLRAIQLGQWKTKRTTARRLIRLGVSPRMVWRRVYDGRKSIWTLSWDIVAHHGLGNAYFAACGLVSLAARYTELRAVHAAPVGSGPHRDAARS